MKSPPMRGQSLFELRNASTERSCRYMAESASARSISSPHWARDPTRGTPFTPSHFRTPPASEYLMVLL